eukprot:CAMPEP_0172067888 /NCGR_PEP_ID=MMETSP1043-20130122/11926_1 /TAXON_ID=464988 /ORGANISM="Hemiselmis andersenii, Strain CCMP441" /LENGTH=103 /DNA_ID=CAMNT_0012728127 /DNA_START=201 /DNA_END=508 /DNA_ORIENTATION=+
MASEEWHRRKRTCRADDERGITPRLLTTQAQAQALNEAPAPPRTQARIGGTAFQADGFELDMFDMPHSRRDYAGAGVFAQAAEAAQRSEAPAPPRTQARIGGT